MPANLFQTTFPGLPLLRLSILLFTLFSIPTICAPTEPDYKALYSAARNPYYGTTRSEFDDLDLSNFPPPGIQYTTPAYEDLDLRDPTAPEPPRPEFVTVDVLFHPSVNNASTHHDFLYLLKTPVETQTWYPDHTHTVPNGVRARTRGLKLNVVSSVLEFFMHPYVQYVCVVETEGGKYEHCFTLQDAILKGEMKAAEQKRLWELEQIKRKRIREAFFGPDGVQAGL